MLQSYLKIAYRNLVRHKGFTAINVTGLAAGVACCLLITLYVQHEWSYDRFHPDADRLYRVALDLRFQDQALQTALTPPPMAPALVAEIPEVEATTRLWYDFSGSMTVRYGDVGFMEDRVVFADPNVFDIFGFEWIEGDPGTALQEPYTVVLTRTTARKYFGEASPLGKTMQFREASDRDIFDYTVTGVVADPPATSHITFDFLNAFVTQRGSRSENWLNLGVYTYAKLRPDAEAGEAGEKISTLAGTRATPQLSDAFGLSPTEFAAEGNALRYFVQPVTDIHLHSNLEDELQPAGSAGVMYMLIAIALFVLVLACINFVNLSTARSVRRAREVGVRKTFGSHRFQLVFQFLTEATLVALLAVTLAVALVQAVMPLFNETTGLALTLESLFDGPTPLLLLGLAVMVGWGAGLYPAFYLSGFKPVAVLKGLSGTRRSRLRDGLVVFQFVVSIALIAGTALIYLQTEYMLNTSLGFDAEQVVVLEGAEVMGSQAEAFKNAVRGLPGVVQVSNSELVPGRSFDTALFRMEDAPTDATVPLAYTYTGFDFVETLGLELVEGRSLLRDRAADSLGVLLNETAVQTLNLTEPVGQRLEWPGESIYTIVGVVKDFHTTSLHRSIGPVALLGPDPRNSNRPNLLISVRVAAHAWTQTLPALEAAWQRFAPQQPFVYSALDANFEALYRAEQTTSRLVSFLAGLAVLIACCGLFGLAAFTTEQRTKEIGVRKVMGATVTGLVGLLSKDFLKLVGLAFVLAIPPAYWGMQYWLEGFAYRIDLSWTVFVWAGLVAMLVAWLTVGYQALKAALANPIDALRYE